MKYVSNMNFFSLFCEALLRIFCIYDEFMQSGLHMKINMV